MTLWVVVAGQGADLVTFFAAAAVLPIGLEVNPLARGLAAFGLPAVFFGKSAVLVVSLALVEFLQRAPWQFLRVAAVAIPTLIGLAGAAANIAALSAVLAGVA